MPIGHYLFLSGLLFAIGTAGVFLRRNLITLLLSIEIMLNAVNLAFVAFSRAVWDMTGHVFMIMALTLAAAEVAIGLALVVTIYSHRETLNIDVMKMLKG